MLSRSLNGKPIERIIFYRSDRIGDVLMNLPAIHSLRVRFPKSWITLALQKDLLALLENHPDIDECVPLPESMTHLDSHWPDLSWVRDIRKCRYDLSIVANPQKKAHLGFYLAGIPMRLGYKRKWGFLNNLRADYMSSVEPVHESRKNLSLVSVLGADMTRTCFKLPEAPSATSNINSKLRCGGVKPEQSRIVMHMSSSVPAKCWDSDNYKQLTQRFLNSAPDVSVIFVGAESDMRAADSVISSLDELDRKRSLNLCGQTRLDELIALFDPKFTKLFISSDSGPAHVAWMRGCRGIIFYSKDAVGSNPVVWGPLSNGVITIHDHMANIKVEQVYNEAMKIFG